MLFTTNALARCGCLAIAVFAAAGIASAQDFSGNEAAQTLRHSKPKFFQADYGFTTSNNCVRATPHPPSVVGIDPVTRALRVPGEVVSQAGGGVMHFHRNGRLTLEATASEVNQSQLAQGALPQTAGLDGRCEGTYTLSTGNRISFSFNCRVDIPSQGVSFDLGPTNAEGFISEDGTSMNLSQTDDLQTVTLALPNGATLVSERLCVQRFSLSKISGNSRGFQRSAAVSAKDE